MRSMGSRGSHRLRIRRRFVEKALITFPFHDPPTNRAMTVAHKFRVEHRCAPRAPGAQPGGECAARTIHLVSAVDGCGSAAIRSNRAVTPEAWAARVSLRLATRSNCRASPHTSSTTAPTASQASASAAVRSALSTSDARTLTKKRGSRPSSASPLIDSAPDSISVKSCRTHTSGRRATARAASPAIKPVAAALCRPASAKHLVQRP